MSKKKKDNVLTPTTKTHTPAAKLPHKVSKHAKLIAASAFALTITMTSPLWTQAKASASAAVVVSGLSKETDSGSATRSNQTASVLGVTKQKLKEALKSGFTLAEVAKEQGIASSMVVSTVNSQFTSQLDQELAAGKITAEQYEKQKVVLSSVSAMLVNGQWSG